MSDNLQSNVLTVQPDGTISADFTGVVNALGLTLPASSSSTPTSQNRVAWERQSDGAIVADAVGFIAPNSALKLESRALTPAGLGGQSEVDLSAVDDLGATQAQISVTQTARGGNGSISLSVPGNVGFNLLDSTGASGFLQLALTQQLQLALGRGTFVFTAGTVSAPVAIAHGIGRTPVVCLASCEGVGFTASVARGNPNNTFTGFTATAATANIAFDWVAIG